MMPDLTETVEKQNVIIQMQSGIINELFQLLMQHISVDEADALPVVQRINEAADLRKWMERGGECYGRAVCFYGSTQRI